MDQTQTDINANPQLLPSPREDAEPLIEMQMPAYAPPSIPYDPSFEDDVMEVILNPPAPNADEDDVMDMNIEVLPEDLPLPLHDFRRQYLSIIPGIKLPSPQSDLLGAGAPPTAVLDDLLHQFRAEHSLSTAEDVDHQLNTEIEAQVALLKTQMQQRQEAIEANNTVEKEIRQLNMEREMQRRVEEKWKQGRRESKTSTEMAT